jgi:predicted HAD superfamily Cof-like phosphohydrolase
MTMLDDVRAFHAKFSQPVLTVPAVPNEARVRLRERLITEEYKELVEALGFREMGGDKWLSKTDLPETADAIGDLVYVLLGTALEFGIPMGEVWHRIHEKNMLKTPAETADGKVRKPEGWTPPDIEGALRDAGWRP